MDRNTNFEQNSDAEYFLELQTQTGWGRVLSQFAEWCRPQRGWLTLDVGTGPGLLPDLFAQLGCQAFGVDLDPEMFKPTPLHSAVIVADSLALPFPSQTFDLLTASNLLFLLPHPFDALSEMTRFVRAEGQIALLNPSEHLNVDAATDFADYRGLHGLARETLLNWAARAEKHNRWTESQLVEMFDNVGLELADTKTSVGPGFARFVRGTLSSDERK